jgi:hypothetical protein
MGEFAMHDFNPRTGEFEMVISSTISRQNDVSLDYNETKRPIFWSERISGQFPDSPTCGYNKAKCPVEGKLSIFNRKI